MLPLQIVVAAALFGAGDSENVVLEFAAERRCYPCQQMSPIVSRLLRQNYPIRKIDADRDQETTRQYDVKSLPTFILVLDGREVERIPGKMSEDELKRLCARIPRPPEAKRPPEVELGSPSVDFGKAPSLSEREAKPENSSKPGFFEKLLPKKKKETRPEPPLVARAKSPDDEVITADYVEPAPADPLTATVRIRIKDAQGEDFGTGTIIDSRPGRTLILTCGHIFRHWTEDSLIQIDVFRGAKPKTMIGTRITHDLKDDVALISIPTDRPLPACRVAPPDTKILKGSPVVSVGCNGGDDPTVQAQQITALNRYLGADNIECGVVPARGRSGGGLFDRDGHVIGVCWCANPSDGEGLYAGLKTIHKLLDRKKLTWVYRTRDDAGELLQAAGTQIDSDMVDLGEPESQTGDLEMPPVEPSVPPRELKNQMSAVTSATQPRVSRDDVVGSEVVIIIQSRGEPEGRSKVVRLHRASREFWEYLAPELETQESMLETTMRNERPAGRDQSEVRRARRPTTSDGPTSRTGQPAAAADDAGAPQIYRRRRS
ncbi:MAG: hypothetical protein EXS05_16865 [Planctomycetaceae bacterium]|nr:hypothetical protein [Planctomycetaceae bacterium]